MSEMLEPTFVEKRPPQGSISERGGYTDGWNDAMEHAARIVDGLVSSSPEVAALYEAAERVSDKRTLDSDGFWVSKREMRYLDEALARFRAAKLREDPA